MSRRISRSLSAQLFSGVLLSLLAAAVVFLACFALGTQLLDRTVYGRPFLEQMADLQFAKLQTYVEQEKITVKSLHRLNAWCGQGDEVYLTIYQGDTVLYDCLAVGGELLDAEEYDPGWENPDRAYALTLSDGATVQAFLYYYAGDAYYYWVIGGSGLAAFLIFSLCFITFVHQKLRCIKQLKKELDILAGGDLTYPVTVTGQDELGELALGIDQMRRSILTHQDAEEKMRSANSQLVTAMSHDLRTPLTSLLAYLELMDRGKYEDEAQLRHFISRSLEKTLRIKSMADKLFEYFLVYSSEWEQPEMELADADGTIQQFWGEYAFSLESRGFAVRSDFSRLNGTLAVNIDLLRRAFDNIYANLLKYAAPDGPIEIDCRRERELVQLTVTNHISPQRDKCESTNIGLNTCRRIIQCHGGTFSIREADGRFQAAVTLPLREIGRK